MPIYAYRCAECGHCGEHLQKMSDALLTSCPACKAEKYVKQLSAVALQIKGVSASAPRSGGSCSPACGAGCGHS